MRRYLWLLGCIVLGLSSIVHGEDRVTITESLDIPYLSEDEIESQDLQSLDIYMPEDAVDVPVLFFVHGGAWVSGDKSNLRNIGRTFAQRGIGVVLPNYRLSQAVTHPAHTEDVASAFAWTVNNIADYGGNLDQLFAGGHSAGGHMVSLLVFDDTYLAPHNLDRTAMLGMIAFSGVYKIDDWILNWAKNAFSHEPQDWDDVSPLALVNNDDETTPPFLLLYADDDYAELIVESELMHENLQSANIESDLYMIEARDHFSLPAFIGSQDDSATQIILGWIRGQLATDTIE